MLASRLVKVDLLFRTRVPVGIKEVHVSVEGPLFKFVNSRLVDELGGVDSHHSHYTFLFNWLAINDDYLLFRAVIVFVADVVDLRVASDELNHKVFSKPVPELKGRGLKEFISEVKVTLTDLSLTVNLEVVNPSLPFSLYDLVSTVSEP